MKVQDVMIEDVKSCRPSSNLASAAHTMWANDCGALPVLDDHGQVLGMITDRDIAMALGTRNRVPSDITVSEVKPKSEELYTCGPQDDIHDALKTMQAHQVRRLPVVNSGKLQGILCINDIALKAKKRGSLSYDDVVDTIKAVCEHRTPQQVVAA